jgi:hypothetical protein
VAAAGGGPRAGGGVYVGKGFPPPGDPKAPPGTGLPADGGGDSSEGGDGEGYEGAAGAEYVGDGGGVIAGDPAGGAVGCSNGVANCTRWATAADDVRNKASRPKNICVVFTAVPFAPDSGG